MLTKRANQGDCRFVDFDTVLFQLFGEIAVLQVAQAVNRWRARAILPCAPRQLNSARVEKCGHAVVTRFAIDVASVVGIDVKTDEGFACCCSALLKKAVEQPFPRRGVHAGRLCQHTVEVKQNRVVIPRGQSDNRSYAGHSSLLMLIKVRAAS